MFVIVQTNTTAKNGRRSVRRHGSRMNAGIYETIFLGPQHGRLDALLGLLCHDRRRLLMLTQKMHLRTENSIT
uniref:Uncharacterized protein n=1 Tax=Romanomermis culicivorax TaxID=13658 RepID=A0A915JF59_ROMCU